LEGEEGKAVLAKEQKKEETKDVKQASAEGRK
jgi:hypothetical protein